MPQTTQNHGFTMIEIVSVLIVIGLLIGGVIVGEALLKSSELQAVAMDAEKYKSAVRMFKDKYKELPGDFTTATNIWGTDAGGCPNTTANIAVKTTSCNGDGDGFIAGVVGNSPLVIGTTNNKHYETLRAWQHLSNANLIEQKFNGAISSANTSLQAGINTPVSKLKGGTFNLFYVGTLAAAPELFTHNYNHILVFGAPGASIDIPPNRPALLGKDALNIDTKVDDGRPGTGSVLSYLPAGSSPVPNCVVAGATEYAAAYATTNITACSLIFITNLER